MSDQALLAAIRDGDRARVESLLIQTPGVDVDAFCPTLMHTPLTFAIIFNEKDIVELLFHHGAAVNAPITANTTPLQQACSHEVIKASIVTMLLDRGAGVELTTASLRQTPLTLACRSNSNLGVVQLLINAGADVNGGDGAFAPLHCVARYGNIEVLDLLINSGADVNRVTTAAVGDFPAKSTPLYIATQAGQLKCLNRLLEAGADPNIANANGKTPLHFATSSCIEFVDALLAAGGDPLQRDNNGRTPLQALYFEKSYNYFFQASPMILTTLVAAGDRSWECVPALCPGLEAAMLSVWQAAPDEMPELAKRLKNPPQNVIELFPRMDDTMKKVVQEVVQLLHPHFVDFPHLKERLLKDIFGF